MVHRRHASTPGAPHAPVLWTCPRVALSSCAVSAFRINRLKVQNYRGFAAIDVTLGRRTVLFADNGGGKTALLHAAAVGLAAAFERAPKNILASDLHVVSSDGVFVPAGPARVEVDGEVAGSELNWARQRDVMGSRTSNAECKPLRGVMRDVWGGRDWPILAFYGTQRLWGRINVRYGPPRVAARREQAYDFCLDPRSSESKVLDVVWRSALKALRGERSPQIEAVERALIDATQAAEGSARAVRGLRLDPDSGLPVVEFNEGAPWRWEWLSDGYHAFLGLVADIAVRATLANPHLGREAPRSAEGVVLVDEVDLHLHPRWQRTVMCALSTAFPRLQFIVTTHSPQVLGGVENTEVVELRPEGAVRDFHVRGRDSVGVLLEMGDGGRTAESRLELAAAYRAIDSIAGAADSTEAQRRVEALAQQWGEADSEVVRLRTALSWAEMPEVAGGAE